MVYRIATERDYLRADLFNRETAEESREFFDAVADSATRHQRSCILISVQFLQSDVHGGAVRISHAIHERRRRSCAQDRPDRGRPGAGSPRMSIFELLRSTERNQRAPLSRRAVGNCNGSGRAMRRAAPYANDQHSGLDANSGQPPFVAALLRNRGNCVRDVGDADEALRLVRLEQPDLMIVDIATAPTSTDANSWYRCAATRAWRSRAC